MKILHLNFANMHMNALKVFHVVILREKYNNTRPSDIRWKILMDT